MKPNEMWGRNDFEDGFDAYKTGSSTSPPGWVPGCESAWQGPSSSTTTTTSSSSNRGRRHSAASDSGDTGIGTSCSDSVEDHSSSSGTLSFLPLRSACCIPTAHVMPSPSSSKLSGPSTPSSPWSSCQLPSPLDGPLDMKDPRPVRRWSSLTRLSGQDRGGSCSPRPSYRLDPHGSLDRGLLHGYKHEPSNSDALFSPGSRRFQDSRLGREPAAGTAALAGVDPRRSSPLKPTTLDLSYSALPESRAPGGPPPPNQRGPSLGHQAVGGSPIQPAVRTQMWLSEQMEYRPGPEGCGLSTWQQEQQQRDRLRHDAEISQILAGGAVPVNTLVKIKEGLLRQRELEIDRQKQQILQLHARIRENELRAQQVLQNQRGRCEDPYLLRTQDSLLDGPLSGHSPQAPPPERGSPLCCENGELGRRLATAELEVIHLNEFLKQNTQKYTEDIKKLEEKMKTRDRYISSLKKKVQREQEQSQEKQQRIETLEKYLADLPSLDEVHTQTQQLEEVQGKSQALQETVAQLEQNIKDSHAQLQEKDVIIESQAQREKELVATVQSLQEKVEKCLEDGVRLPMLDLKHLERETARLQEEQRHSRTVDGPGPDTPAVPHLPAGARDTLHCLADSRSHMQELIDSQKQQIDTLSLELMALEKRLQKEKALAQELRRQLMDKEKELETHQKQRPVEEAALRSVPGTALQEAGPLLKEAGSLVKEAGPLLKEMSLCLLDLKALCSVLTQRAQGKEPNLALLLGIRSMSCSGEESEPLPAEDGLPAKLLEVCQLRKDIDELRTAISDRYAQDMGENCVTQ